MSRFHHFAHLSGITVKQGQYVKRGDLIGFVGNSGASSGAHLHYEVWKYRPTNWRQYVRGMSLAQVKERYTDPVAFTVKGIPADNSFPLAGYQFLQYVKERNGGYYHPGIDLNGVNDYGKPVFAPVNGRVVFLEDASALKEKLSNAFRLSINGGWGRHMFIEQDEANPGIKV